MSSADNLFKQFGPRIQARQNFWPDLDPNCLTPCWYSCKNFSNKLIMKIISRQKIFQNFPVSKELKPSFLHRIRCEKLFEAIVKWTWTKIHVQIMRFMCSLYMAFNLPKLKLSPELFAWRYAECIAAMTDHFADAFVCENFLRVYDVVAT